MEIAGTAPSDQASILAATLNEGFLWPARILVRYGRDTPICLATTKSVSFRAAMYSPRVAIALMCPIGTSSVKRFVSVQGYAQRSCGRTIST
jgi:hypothetical protein